MSKRTPAVGETWFIQLDRGCLVLAVEVDELTERTCLLRIVESHGTPAANGAVRRFRTSDVTFLEVVDRPDPPTLPADRQPVFLPADKAVPVGSGWRLCD